MAIEGKIKCDICSEIIELLLPAVVATGAGGRKSMTSSRSDEESSNASLSVLSRSL